VSSPSLAGLKVLELGQGVSAPYCAKLLAGYGAEVVKIEPPTGDPARRHGPFPGDEPHPERSALFLFVNTGKQGITLDVRTPRGRQILLDLVRESDVLVENHPPDFLPGLGLDYDALAAVNPRLVMASVTDFGASGPYRDYQAVPAVVLAVSGYMYLSGSAEREPLALPGYQPDYMAALHGYMGILAALHWRALSGEGQHVEVAAQEVMAALHQFTFILYTHTGIIRTRHGNRWENNHPLTLWPCADGWVSVCIATKDQWERLCLMVGRPELLEDPRYSTGWQRLQHADELDAEFIPWMWERRKRDIFEMAQDEWRVPIGILLSLGELLEDPQYVARAYWQELDHPEAGRLIYPAAPFALRDTPRTDRPAPLLGADNAAVYGGRLGYTADDLVRLRRLGVV
jgi:crotonobetainyl-CoA:carnitine CoA-transferase CaiB-like acyl-CoA transferase